MSTDVATFRVTVSWCMVQHHTSRGGQRKDLVGAVVGGKISVLADSTGEASFLRQTIDSLTRVLREMKVTWWSVTFVLQATWLWVKVAADNATNVDDQEDAMVFQHFVAHNNTMTCTADEHARPFNNQVRGVNLGGWMVLEPWITPSMF